MAAGRGLNKGRGLGSLIPPRKEEKSEEAVKPASEKTEPEKKKTAAPPAKRTAASAGGTGRAKKPAASPAKAVHKKADQLIDPQNAVTEVSLTQIVPNRKQPRKNFDEAAIEELAASIREHGVITPLLVQKKGKYFELIAGERRWRAAKAAGLKKVPVLIREFTEQEAAEVALIENLQREDLNAMEEAQAYRQLIEEYSLKQEEIAQRVSKSRSAIANSLRLLKLDEQVQEMLAGGKISMGHARALLSLENQEMQRITAERVAAADLSVRETEKLVKRLMAPKKPAEKKPADLQIEAIYKDLEEQVMRSVGTRVAILPMKGKKGRVEIEYYSNEDLERILDLLRGGKHE